MICTNCGAENADGFQFCMECGSLLNMPEQKAAFPKAETKLPESFFKEEKSAWAEGLPSWSLEPPSVVVRKH